MEDNDTFRPSRSKKREHIIKSMHGHTQNREGALRDVSRAKIPIDKSKPRLTGCEIYKKQSAPAGVQKKNDQRNVTFGSMGVN